MADSRHPSLVLADYIDKNKGLSPRDAADALTRWTPGYDKESGLARDQFNRALQGFTQEGFRVAEGEDAARERALGFLTEQFGQTTQSTLTDQDINRMYTQEADAAANDQNESLRMLRSTLGGAGVTGGGTAAGIAARMRSARLGQLTGAKANLRSFKARFDADRQMQQWQQALGLGSLMAQGPSDTGLGVLGELVNVRGTQLGTELGYEGAQEMAKATKEAGKWSAVSGVAGGAIGALGSLF